MNDPVKNIYENAIKYNIESGIINIYAKREDKRVIVSIENSGAAIQEDEIENIWKGFYRIEKSRNRKLGGSGLGLRIVKEIIDIHNEYYGVKNTENGVCFWFSIKAV